MCLLEFFPILHTLCDTYYFIWKHTHTQKRTFTFRPKQSLEIKALGTIIGFLSPKKVTKIQPLESNQNYKGSLEINHWNVTSCSDYNYPLEISY